MPTPRLFFIVFFFIVILHAGAQQLKIGHQDGLTVLGLVDKANTFYTLPNDRALFTFQANGVIINPGELPVAADDSSYSFDYDGRVSGRVIPDQLHDEVWTCRIILSNISGDTIELENIVPFGELDDHIYLASTGPWALARARLFRPGHGPVGVILPDNAWEMGYGDIPLVDGESLCAMARRTGSEKADRRRYKTIVYPGGHVEYSLWANIYKGEWQNGLKRMFHDRYLYDLDNFNDSLYHRADLRWIRHSYLIGLQFAWNKEFYDWKNQQYNIDRFLDRGRSYFGGYDVLGLWPTWPRLGVDQRNQWDMFADMPGGLDQIRELSQRMKAEGTRFFICYNPWDESTRSENPYSGMAGLIRATDADGVVLDCHGASSYDLQHAADSVKPGVVMYSEGMAVVKDMPGIVAGRVHDAIHMSPPLNLNKLIRPDFAIFRVCQVRDGRIKREAAIAFFNGYGTELNTFAPGNAGNMEDDLFYLGRTTRILRENTSNFLSPEWTPLIQSSKDSIWVNRWPLNGKTIYTILSMVPEGFHGPLFEIAPEEGTHLVSLWHHLELEATEQDGKLSVPVTVEAFNHYDLNTRAEGNVDCIAVFPRIIKARIEGATLHMDAATGDLLKVWAGDPSYQNDKCIELEPGVHQRSIFDSPFNNFEGKYVIQLFQDGELADETVLNVQPGTPRLISGKVKTKPADKRPDGMVLVSAGAFDYRTENTDQFIPYPDIREPIRTFVDSFYIDEFPVTNAQYRSFLEESGYFPEDTVNFLKHWVSGSIPEGLEDHPVVYISLEDARAYAEWAGKRLPTEVEWQYAAQGRESLTWPWGNKFDSTYCNFTGTATTAVYQYPKGRSPFGVCDLTGNVWQLTNDVYDNGTYYFVIMKGGSFYKPTSSWWYVKGGPQPSTWHQQLLLVAPSFDRNATVGFRCVKDTRP